MMGSRREQVRHLKGRNGLPYYLIVKTRPRHLVDDATAIWLLTAVRNLLPHNVLFERDLGNSDVDCDVLQKEIIENAEVSEEFARFCSQANLKALDDLGAIIEESAQQFNWYRWGQEVFTAVLSPDRISASKSYQRLASFARDHDLRLHAFLPPGAVINIDHPEELPPGWRELME